MGNILKSMMNKTKKVAKDVFKKIIKKIAFLLGKAIIAILTALGPWGIMLLILLFVTIDFLNGLFSQEVDDSVKNIVEETVQSISNDADLEQQQSIVLNLVNIEGNENDGYYFHLDRDKLKESLEKQFKEKDLNIRDMEMSSLDILIDFIEMEIYTQLPNISKDPENIKSDGNKIQGAIKIKKESYNHSIQKIIEDAKNDVEIDESNVPSENFYLTYIDNETFDEYVKNNNEEVTKHFTLDESKNIILASWSYDETTGISISQTSPIDYRTKIQKYTMPYQYPFIFLLETRKEDFAVKLANLAKETEIIITVMENIGISVKKEVIETTTTEATKEFKKYEDGTTNETGYLNEKVIDETTEENKYVSASASNQVCLTSVNAWCTKASRNFISDFTSSDYSETNSNEKKGEYELVTDNEKNAKEETDNKNNKYQEWINTYNRKDIKTTEYNKTIKNSYKENPDEESTANENLDKVIELFNSYDTSVMSNLRSDKAAGLINLLQNNKSTSGMVELTKWILQKCYTKFNFGLKDYDFSCYDLEEFTDINSVVSAPGLSTVMNFTFQFENDIPPMNADGTKYKIELDNDGEDARPVVGYGVDILTHIDKFLAAGQSTEPGEYVDKEFVDKIAEEEIADWDKFVRNNVATEIDLTEYQIAALVSRCYQMGAGKMYKKNPKTYEIGALGYRNGKNFIQAFKAYWNKEKDDLAKTKNNKADFNHKLYTEYMQYPNDNGHPGFVARREAEWTLFQTGYMRGLDIWYSSGGIIQKADEIHKYMEENNYLYCVYYSNDYEECGKYNDKCGLNSTFEASKTGYHHTCCATYVSWVLQEAGYIDVKDHSNGAITLKDNLKKKGFKEVSISEAQPGDILYYSYGHIEIYAGDNKVYNAGSGSAIRGSSPQYNDGWKSATVLRAPN